MTHRTAHVIHTLFLGVSLLIPSSAQAITDGYLHASGLYIVDGSNSRIQLRGMGLGGWLVPEGYMLLTSGFANSPTEIRTAITNVAGAAGADQFFTQYRTSFVQRKDIDSLARWGFNSVRLPMHFNLLSSSPGVYTESGFATIDSLLAWCEANHLYLILDLHCAPGGQNSGNISDYQGFPSLWESPDFQTWTAELWKTIAARYATRPWIGGYDMLNETAWTFSGGNTPLRDLLVRITDSIRTVDKNHLVFAEGNWYATDFSGLTPAWDTNMAWSFHKYWNPNDYAAFQGYLNLRASTNTPLWMGESGENSNQWFSNALTLLEGYQIGWAWWTLKKMETISAPFSVKKHAGFDALLKYWNGQGPQPTQALALNSLLAQAQLFDAALCVPHPDVLHALFVQPKSVARVPWTANAIPGTLYASGYDMGHAGLAYLDIDYEIIAGQGGGAYNSGWTYRNDGVDIEACTDTGSNGYDVGWTNPGEFLGFTVDVKVNASFFVRARVASGASGGSFKLSADGVDITPAITVPGTGGWQVWQTVQSACELTAGMHDLRIHFLSTNVNLNRLTFSILSNAVPTDHETPASFRLEQNYPNPFNPNSEIRYQISEFGIVRLAVYDLLGKEVAVLVNEKQPPGAYTVRFDGKRLSSGAYYYRLQSGGATATRAMVLSR
jgi:endoglucanase